MITTIIVYTIIHEGKTSRQQVGGVSVSIEQSNFEILEVVGNTIRLPKLPGNHNWAKIQ